MRKISVVLAFLFLRQSLSQAQDHSPTRREIYNALVVGKVLDPDRQLVHYSHTCSINLDGASYPVIDVQELVKGGASPRGVNRIVILSPAMAPLKEIAYTRQRPLFCAGDRLYVYGDLRLDDRSSEGNLLTFKNRGRSVKLSHVDANDYDAPLTRERKRPPQ